MTKRTAKRTYISVAIAALACATQALVFGATDAQSLYQQGIKAQDGNGPAIDLPAARALLEKAAAAGSAQAMHRLGDMYHDGDGGCVKDYAKALEWYHQEAALDDKRPGAGALGMVEIAQAYEEGRGIAKDQSLATDWYKKAAASAQIGANKGELTATLALAYLQSEGKGTKLDPVHAWNWAIKASETPNPWSEEMMAAMYFRGIGVEKNPESALRCILRAAQMGVSQDMVDASLCFASGLGVKSDPAKALEWAQKGVDRGNSRAMAILGRYYHQGAGVERLDTTAKEWYQKAIDMGDEAALGFMGDLSIMPGANPRNPNAAITWYQEGATKGDTYSMFQLASLLTKDPDVPHDVNRATALLRQASDLGNGESMNALGELYRTRVLSGTTADALDWFHKSADAGCPAGMRNLGEMLYKQGLGDRVRTDDDNAPMLAEGIKWYTAAAGGGDADAMADLGEVYWSGLGAPQNNGTAGTWFRKAADSGSIRGMRNLGLMFADGRSLGTDYQAAYKWLKLASDANDAAATAALGELWEKGVGVPTDAPQGRPGVMTVAAPAPKPNYARATELYLRALQAGDAGGYRGMAHLYEEGLGVDKDLKRAAQLYQSAVDLNDQRSMEALGWMYELGQGVPKNSVIARRLFQKSADMFGSFTATSWLVSHDPNPVIGPATAPAGRGGTL